MHCVSLLFFFFPSTADSPWIILQKSTLLNMGENKVVVVWVKQSKLYGVRPGYFHYFHTTERCFLIMMLADDKIHK